MTKALTTAEAHKLVPEINAHYREFKKAANDGMKNAIKIGELLLKMKEALPHGEFIQAVEERCDFEIRWGQLCMKVAGGQDVLRKIDQKPESVSEAAKLIAEHTPKAKPNAHSNAHLKSASDDSETTSENPPTQSESPDSRAETNEEGELLNEHVKDFKEDGEQEPEPPKLPKKANWTNETPIKDRFALLLEYIRQGVLLCDSINNSTGKKHERLREYTVTGLDSAGQEAQKWRRLCK